MTWVDLFFVIFLGLLAVATAAMRLYHWLIERNRRQMAEYMAGPYLVKREEAWKRHLARYKAAQAARE